MFFLTIPFILANEGPIISILCLLGVVCSYYAMKIENAMPRTKQMCDINESIGCTIVLTSKYAHLMRLFFNLEKGSIFDKSNAFYGLCFYTALFIVYWIPLPYHGLIFFLMTLPSIAASCGLAWILYKYLQMLCLICVTTYIINFALMFVAFLSLINITTFVL